MTWREQLTARTGMLRWLARHACMHACIVHACMHACPIALTHHIRGPSWAHATQQQVVLSPTAPPENSSLRRAAGRWSFV